MIWDLVQGQKVRTLEDVRYTAYHKVAAALWPERGWLVLGSAWGTVEVWDMARGDKVRTFSGDSRTATVMGFAMVGLADMKRDLAGLFGPVTALALWPERGWVVSAFWNGALKVWDLETEQEVHTLTGHDGLVTRVALWPEWGLAVSISGNSLMAWDLVRGICLATFIGESPLTACAVAPGDPILVAGEHGGKVHFLKLENQGQTPAPPEGAVRK
jgi:WD40 repeat protein